MWNELKFAQSCVSSLSLTAIGRCPDQTRASILVSVGPFHATQAGPEWSDHIKPALTNLLWLLLSHWPRPKSSVFHRRRIIWATTRPECWLTPVATTPQPGMAPELKYPLWPSLQTRVQVRGLFNNMEENQVGQGHNFLCAVVKKHSERAVCVFLCISRLVGESKI